MASAFIIEKGIPLQKDRRGGRIYPFDEMEVGDSFEAPYSTKLTRAAHQHGKRHGQKFAARKPYRGSKTVRVWRVA